MVKIGTVWDRTTDVIGGRGGMLAGIAGAGIFLPTVIQSAFQDFKLPAAGLVGLIATLVMLWATLALVAASSDPMRDRAAAQRIATARYLPTLGAVLIVVLVLALFALPGLVLLYQAGFDFQAAASQQPQTNLDMGKAAWTGLFFLAYMIALFWIGARLILMYPVLVNEREGLGSIRRSLALTRGLTWKIIGVLILWAIVFLVALMATTSIVGVVFRLILGPDQIAVSTFIAGIASAIITTAASVVQAVFTAQLYLAARADRDGPIEATLTE